MLIKIMEAKTFNMNKETRGEESKKSGRIVLGIIIDTDLSIPPKTGVTYRLYYLSKWLVVKGVDVKLFLCNRGIESEGDLKKLFSQSGIEIHIIPQNVFYNPVQMEEIVKKAKINILQFEDPVSVIRFHRISVNLQIPVCLEMHDVEATLIKKLGFKDSDIDYSKIITSEAVLLSDKTVCMTQTDMHELIDLIKVNPKKLSLIPNPIDLYEFQYFGPNIKSLNILFIGNMFYRPNQNAAKFVVQKLYPRLKKLIPDSHFILVGMIPANVKKLFTKNKDVVVTGAVDELDEILKNGTIAVCPVTEGSGMKVKILNYSAAGLPIITTRMGASGYENIPSLIIEDNLEKYPELIASLFEDKKRMIETGKTNRKFVEENYDVSVVADKIIAIYKGLMNTPVVSKERILPNDKQKKLPTPLWTKEKRAKRLANQNYYIIKNNKVISVEILPKILIVEGFWGIGKTTFINSLSKKHQFVFIPEPDHLDKNIKRNVSQWYLSQHQKRFKLALNYLSNGDNVVLERSVISSIAFHYAKKGILPKWSRKVLDDISTRKNLQVIFLENSKYNSISQHRHLIKDKDVLDIIKHESNFYNRYIHFYKKLLPLMTKNKIVSIKIKKGYRSGIKKINW